jgi:hypothetical protein
VLFVFDLSGSFRDMIAKDDGKAYRFALKVLDDMFRSRAGNKDRVVIAQISGKYDKPLLWAGSPRDFKRDFPSARVFQDYLVSRSSPDGSPVYRGMADSIEYVVSLHERNPGMQSLCLVFSDFLDNDPETTTQEERLLTNLREYRKYGPGIGLYWIDGSLRGQWQKRLTQCGFQGVIETDIVSYPEVPKFEQ